MQSTSVPLRLPQGVGCLVFGTLKCERRLGGAVLQVEQADTDVSVCDVIVQGSMPDCCSAVLQILHHASAAHSQSSDLSNVVQPVWQLKQQDDQQTLSSQQLNSMPPEALNIAEPCLHLPSSCLLPLPLAVQCCQALSQGQTTPQDQPLLSTSPSPDQEDKDGDVVMADEEVEQLIVSLQAARHDSTEWESAAKHASISMLLFGRQAPAEQEPTAMDFAITKPGAVRLYVILDTSVLLSHWAFIQALHRNLGQNGVVAAEHAGTPGVQVLLVVPWAVLVELDKLKEEHSVLRIQGGKREVAPLARRAIKGLASMLTRDRCLQYQSEADAIKANKTFGVAGKRVLNDDSIIHCAMDVQRRMHEAHLQGDDEASKSGAVLLTKDNNMTLKAQANKLKALSPAHFPAAQPHLHKQLLVISSDTSPVKHTHAQDTSPATSPRRPPGLSLNPPKEMAGLITGAPDSSCSPTHFVGGAAVGVTSATSRADISKSLSGISLAQLQLSQQADQQQAKLTQQHQSQQEPLHQSQQALQQALSNYQQHQHQQQQQHQHQHQHQQQQQQQQQIVSGSLFKLQESPMVHRGMVTGSHGYPRAPLTTAQPQSLPALELLASQQPLSVPHSMTQTLFGDTNGSMQHQQGGFPGNVLQRQMSNGRGIANSMGNTAIGDSRTLNLQLGTGLESRAASFGGASSSGSVDAQELSDRMWQVVVEGLQPFMRWELQAGMGDFWEQAVSRAPPWDVGDMLAVMKKNMSSSLHSNADLSRCHARLQAAYKLKGRPTTLQALADLASHASSLLLKLPLPAKSDKVAHVKAGAVTGLEARLALQKGREEAQCLLKLAQTAIQQQQQQPPLRSTSFPPRGAPRPIGPQPTQALVASGSQGQSRATLPLQASDESPRAVLDPILDSRQLRHARQALPQLALANETSLGYLSNAFASPSMWQQDGLHQRAASPSVINPASHDGHRNGTYTPAAQQAANRSWGPSWLPSQQSLTHRPQHQIVNDTGANGLGATGWQERSGTAGSDPLHSAQGLLQTFGKFAAEHLHKIQKEVQQHPGDAHVVEQSLLTAHTIADAAKLLMHAVAIVNSSETPQHRVEVVRQCAQDMLTIVFWILDQQHAIPSLRPVLVGDLCSFFTYPDCAQAAANLAQQLQQTAQSVIAGNHVQ